MNPETSIHACEVCGEELLYCKHYLKPTKIHHIYVEGTVVSIATVGKDYKSASFNNFDLCTWCKTMRSCDLTESGCGVLS